MTTRAYPGSATRANLSKQVRLCAARLPADSAARFVELMTEVARCYRREALLAHLDVLL